MATPPFLQKLLTVIAPSGYETPAGAIWRAEAESFADQVTHDTIGSSVARVAAADGGDGRRLLGFVGHIDEIGLCVSYIAEKGQLHFQPVGGWDPQVLVGQRVTVQGQNGPVAGVIGRKPIHLLEEEERKKVAKIDDMYVDIGASSRDDAARL